MFGSLGPHIRGHGSPKKGVALELSAPRQRLVSFLHSELLGGAISGRELKGYLLSLGSPLGFAGDSTLLDGPVCETRDFLVVSLGRTQRVMRVTHVRVARCEGRKWIVVEACEGRSASSLPEDVEISQLCLLSFPTHKNSFRFLGC